MTGTGIRILLSIAVGTALTAGRVGAADFTKPFDELWAEMDRSYSYFELKKVDWQAIKTKYRPRAEAAKTVPQFVGVLQAMLTELKDQHIWIDSPAGRLGTFQQPVVENRSVAGLRARIATAEQVGKFVSVGTTTDGYGLLVVENQAAATPELARNAVAKIERLADVPGFVVDLRGATGGNEAHTMPLASAFCGKDVVYAKHKFRAGPRHDEYGPTHERTLPAGKKPFTKPVVVLIGTRVMSSGEGLAMMFAALPHVTTVGSRTRGSSGNPMPFELKGVGVTVTFSRWVAMQPNGTPIEGRGVMPTILAEFPPSAFGKADPVLERALDVLKMK